MRAVTRGGWFREILHYPVFGSDTSFKRVSRSRDWPALMRAFGQPFRVLLHRFNRLTEATASERARKLRNSMREARLKVARRTERKIGRTRENGSLNWPSAAATDAQSPIWRDLRSMARRSDASIGRIRICSFWNNIEADIFRYSSNTYFPELPTVLLCSPMSCTPWNFFDNLRNACLIDWRFNLKLRSESRRSHVELRKAYRTCITDINIKNLYRNIFKRIIRIVSLDLRLLKKKSCCDNVYAWHDLA